MQEPQWQSLHQCLRESLELIQLAEGLRLKQLDESCVPELRQLQGGCEQVPKTLVQQAESP